jgi:hypothetical protein
MSTHFDYMTPLPDATGEPSGNSGRLVYESGYSRSDDVPAFDLIEPAFITAMAEVMSEGEKLHGKDNWKRATPDEQGVTVRHLMGHLMRWLTGDRSEPHLAKVAIGAMFLHYHDHKCESK